MKINIENCFAAICMGVALISACSADVEIDGSMKPVPISMVMEDVHAETRGISPIINIDELKKHRFGVFAVCTDGVDFEESTQFEDFFLQNWEFVAAGADGLSWVGNPQVYWPTGSNKVSFFAYTPYDRSLSSQVQVYDEYLDSQRGPLQLVCTPSTNNITTQIDLCVNDASQTINKTRADDVKMKFSHALTQVNFSAQFTGTLPIDGYEVRVEKLILKNVVGSNILTYDLQPSDETIFSWADDVTGQPRVDYELFRDKNHLIGEFLKNDKYQLLQFNDGYLYLIPQKPEDVKLDVIYSFVDGKIAVTQFIKEVSLPSDVEWEPGKVINYKMTVNIGHSSMITIDDVKDEGMIEEWNESNNNANITFR